MGFIRSIKHKWFGRPAYISGRCLQCGACCQDLVLDVDGSWMTSKRQFDTLVRDNPDYSRFEINGRDAGGLLHFRCTWLRQDGTCRDHKRRLTICHSFPDREMFFMNGRLPDNCGYSFRQTVLFESTLKKALTQDPG